MSTSSFVSSLLNTYCLCDNRISVFLSDCESATTSTVHLRKELSWIKSKVEIIMVNCMLLQFVANCYGAFAVVETEARSKGMNVEEISKLMDEAFASIKGSQNHD